MGSMQDHVSRRSQRSGLDLVTLADLVSHGLGGNVTRERVEHVLEELLTGEFADARVVTFMPIFLQRAALERLRDETSAANGCPR